VKLSVLYIVYWGASEPLGQSLVLPAVRELARLGAELTLVTFEKPADLERRDEMDRIGAMLSAEGVRWLPLRYHKRPKAPATLYDVARGVACGLALRFKGQFDIVHARTFVGGLMGMALAPLIGARLIYHNEGFYPDEQVDSGVWRENSAPHRLAKHLEARMYARADGIIAMSHRGRRQIEVMPEVARRGTPVVVVPSCVDLELFRCINSPLLLDDRLRLVYSGSVGGRYILDRIGRFAAVSMGIFPDLHLQVLTRADRGLVGTMLKVGGLPDERWSVESASYWEMPGRLEGSSAGLSFLASGLSEHGGSPTKVGEYWAMGLPIVTTPNNSDMDEIIRRERVGVVVRGHADQDYQQAARELRELLQDPELESRCRRAAEKHYSLESACEQQIRLYGQLLERPIPVLRRRSREQ
jgi:glycosyltransferase involved in cell wall biosynthesis